MGHPIVLYDGVCGLCNRFVQFVLSHDLGAVFRFAALQSSLGHKILVKHGRDASDLDTVYVVLDYDLEGTAEKSAGESILARSDAVSFVLHELGGIWRVGAGVIRLLPRAVRDWGYRVLARNRYRIFGRYDACPVPSEETRARFLE